MTVAVAPSRQLSPEQQKVVDHRGGHLQVIACAGSGKTESISRRVAALIGEGADPASIVAFTFTERAATELKERITSRVADRMGPEFRDRLGPMFVGTIHAYCFRILQDHVPKYGNFDVLDEHRHAGFLSREHRRLGLSKLKAKHWAPMAIDVLEELDAVECYTPNSRKIGMTVPYRYNDAPMRYEPDFVVRLHGGKMLVIEIKGMGGLIHDENQVAAKNAAAAKWIQAVNNAKRYGEWAFVYCDDPVALRPQILAHVDKAAAAILPFRYVTPKASERFETCVPLTSLRAAAGRFSEEQAGLDEMGAWTSEWVTWDDHPKFEPGMFVAKVQGKSMEPEIPDSAYCLFRPPPAGSRQGRRLLVWHVGIDDPMTSGHYTLKVYTSEKASGEEGPWQHTKIVLKPLNPAFEAIVLTPTDEGDVRIVAELVRAISRT